MEPAAENNKGGGHFRKSEALLLLFSPGPYYLPSGIPSFISAGALSPSTVVLSPRPSHILTKLKISPSGHAENILRMGKIDKNGRRRRKITRRTPPPSTGRLIWTDGLKTLAGKNRATYLLSKGQRGFEGGRRGEEDDDEGQVTRTTPTKGGRASMERIQRGR